MFGTKKKSKYKESSDFNWDWWNEAEEEKYKATQQPLIGEVVGEDDDYYYGGYQRTDYGTYGNYYTPKKDFSWYKPKYDMSVSLETRVVQLVKTITGKDLKVVQAQGWGNDEKYFYYNPEDLKEATDDEVLGRILHQLAKERHIDSKRVAEKNTVEPDYKHLLNTLEDNRADNLLQQDYQGCKYYADDLWQTRKFTENPINNVVEGGEKMSPERALADALEKSGNEIWDESSKSFIRDNYFKDLGTRNAVEDNLLKPKGIDLNNYDGSTPANDAWEFCFNIMAKQNGEEAWDFTHPAIEEQFKKALPYIEQYLAATTFDEALKVYPTIQKYYPKPNQQQQDQMDQAMKNIQGLSQAQMEAEGRGAEATAKSMESEEEGREVINFKKDFADNDEWGEFHTEKNSLANYKSYLAEHQGTANTLHALIRSILQDNAVKRYNRPFKRGKLDAGRIYKYLATDNLRIFKKQRTISDKKYAMTIVVDMSGSMRGKESKYAAQAAIVLSNVLEKLKFPYEVIAYNGHVYNVKRFNEAVKPEMLAVLEYAQGDNNELETIKTVIKHIKAFDSSKVYHKAIFWITDGQAYQPDAVKQKVSELEAEHNATVFAIGIGGVSENAMKRSYTNYLMVDTIQQLPKELIRLMRSQFRRQG